MVRTACVKRTIATAIAAIVLMPCFKQISSANAQYAEAQTIFENGARKSTQLTVHFKEKAFDLSQGVRQASISDIDPSLSKLRNFFDGLQSKHGAIEFTKVIPEAKWGDVWRRNKRTGELVQLHDMSQLFFVRFAQFVPIDSIIAELQQLPEVEYAHRPIEAISLADPNDPLYPNGQWNLKKIDAPKAWDITTGSSTIVVGIIEDGRDPANSGLPDKNHKDFWTGSGSTGESKFVAGKGDGSGFGFHATNVAGIIGAATNDGDGVASLGWNIKMIPYRFSNYESGLNNLVAKIDTAISNGCDVINCSFVTRSLTGEEIQECTVY